MIKTIKALFVGIGLVSVVLSIAPTRALAQFYPAPGTPLATPYVTPEPCASGQGHVPPGSRSPAYCPNLARACDVFEKNPAEKDQCLAEAEQYVKTCANSYEEWLDDKERNFWVKDPEVTSLGKGGGAAAIIFFMGFNSSFNRRSSGALGRLEALKKCSNVLDPYRRDYYGNRNYRWSAEQL